ncbi:methyltransferase [Oceanivirga salmonicida]|uniref:methyltransferase n=1 Tax=Oceanivirga salmonicida TaxID=1769291 RepID=UPI00082A38BF|nr:methyltransferase [Oceanivirga salmonicida]
MYIENIDKKQIKINKCFKITDDAILLAKYILEDDINGNTALEIGAGSGYISLKLENKFKNIIALEIQKLAYDNLKENLVKNEISNIKVLNEDVKKHCGIYDIIYSNPPYYKLNSGKLPDDNIKLFSKFEAKLTLKELVENTYRLLKKGGLFYYIYPLNRLKELEKEIVKNNMNIVDIQEINNRIILKGKK